MGRLSETLNSMAQEIKGRQEQIQQHSQQLEDLVSTFSHDLRTPLLANRSMLNAMIGGAFGPVSHEFKALLEGYREGNDDLIKLVETLLDISRYEAGGSQILNQERLDWEKICHRVIIWITNSSQGKCALQTSIEPDLPTVKGDAVEIQRVLQNLVDNAVRLSEAGQQVWIEVTSPDPASVQVAVRDQGPGLKKQEISHLFYRFSQGAGRQGRAGLGLYLCRQIIKAHAGKIGVDSILGQGSTFWFRVPAHNAKESGV
jgi:signal transduction histidine kinase